MRATRVRMIATITLLAAGPGSAGAAGIPVQDDSVVTSTARFELRSDPRVALHHFLIAWASADAGQWPPYALQLNERDEAAALLDETEQRVWSAAVRAYGATVGRSLLFDPGMLAVRSWAAGERTIEEIPHADRPLAEAVDRAMPVYQRHWWPAHDARVRTWIESVTPTLAAVEEEMIRRFEAAYGGTWPDTTTPVDVMVHANPVGAYSTAGRLTVSSAPLGMQMPQAIEMVFHEASHADPLEGPLRAAWDEAFRTAGGEAPERFWHDVIFFTSGEITRLTLAGQGQPGYEHYGTLGVYRRGERWATLLPIFEAHWRPFLESDSPDAVRRVRAMEAVAAEVLAGPLGEPGNPVVSGASPAPGLPSTAFGGAR